MIDPAYYIISEPLLATQIASLTDAHVLRLADRKIRIVAEVAEDDLSGAIIYIEKEKFLDQAMGKSCAAIIASSPIAQKLPPDSFPNTSIFTHENPKAAFSKIAGALAQCRLEAQGLQSVPKEDIPDGVHHSSIIDKTASIGKNCIIGAHCMIGPGVRIGDQAIIGSNVCISHARIGNGCEISYGAVIGGAGFGYVPTQGEPVRVPQLGGVIIGDNVRIGANCTIDRGGLRDTIIGSGTKLDNQVHVAHNVVIGENCLLAAQIGFAGSCQIGNNVMMGGQIGVKDHLTIGDNVTVNAKSGVIKSIPSNESWGGNPAKPLKIWLREMAVISRTAKRKSSKL